MVATDYKDVKFKNIIFENADAQRCVFENCEFENCKFIGSNLAFAYFDSDCKFNKVTFSNCHLEYMTIPEKLKESVTLERSYLDKVLLK